MGAELQIRLQPRQASLVSLVADSPARFIAFGGSRGSAKSHGARAAVLIQASMHKGSRHLLFRRTYEQLYQNHIKPLFAEFPELEPSFHTGHRELTLPNKSSIVFSYAEHASDLKSLQGQEFRTIAVDEATHLTGDELLFLKTCNRAPNVPDRQCKMILTCNPGGVGHNFIKRLFIDREYREYENPEDYAFIQARSWDNICWSLSALADLGLTGDCHDKKCGKCAWCVYYHGWSDKERFEFFISKTEYGKNLNSLPEALRIGNLLGSWGKFSGQYFTNFDPSKHVYDARSLELKPWWPRWVSIDWGFQHPSAVYWHAMADDKTVFTYREFVQNQLSPGMLAAAIVDRSEGEKISQVWLSPDAWQKRGVTDTNAEQLGKELRSHKLPFPAQADNDRKGGWMLMYSMLERNEWRIANTCTELIKTLPMLSRDENNLEDCVKFDASDDGTGGDDPADAARYGLKSRLRPGAMPQADRFQERVKDQGITEPHSEMIWRNKWQHEARTKPIKFARRRR